MSADHLPDQQWNTDPEDRETWQSVGKDGRMSVCFGMKKTVPKPWEKEEDFRS
jgi:hypothetical protein